MKKSELKKLIKEELEDKKSITPEEAFEQVSKTGKSISLPGDSYINKMSKYKFLPELISNGGLYVYNKNLFSYKPESRDPNYGGYGSHTLSLIDKNKMVFNLENAIKQLK